MSQHDAKTFRSAESVPLHLNKIGAVGPNTGETAVSRPKGFLAPDETHLKQSRNPIVLNGAPARPDQRSEREIIMIQIGSKEEVALLLALFGTHTQPVKRPKPKSSRG